MCNTLYIYICIYVCVYMRTDICKCFLICAHIFVKLKNVNICIYLSTHMFIVQEVVLVYCLGNRTCRNGL